MAKKNELPALIASLVVTLALLGGGAWWLKGSLLSDSNNSNGSNTATLQNNGGGSNRPSSSGDIAGADGSRGRSVLAEAEITGAKQDGMDALADGNYDEAVTAFEASLQEKKNDPEARIYLNNATIGNDRAYTVAMIVPAGSSESAAEELMRGAAQAQTDINEAGGVGGRSLKILLINDDDDSDTAVEIANELVDDPDVLGVVGHYSSGTSLAASEVYEAGGLPMISPTSTAVGLSTAGDYIFRTVPSDRLAAATLSRYTLNDLNKTQAVVFYTSESAYSQSVKSEFTTELLSNGGQVVVDFDVSQPGFNAEEALAEAAENGADVLMLALNTATIDIANDVIAANGQMLPMLGGDSLYNPKILDVSRGEALGLTVAVPWHILSHVGTPFVTESRDLWGGDVNWRTATAYDAVLTLATGIDTEQSRDGVAEALAATGLTIDGATDPIKFLPTGDRNQPSQLVEVVPGTRSGTGFDYEPVR
ncbi:MAG: ABC transporter substrate-binding protein [Cyanobacteria bacterium J06621_3]